MWVQVTVVDGVADRLQAATGTVEGGKCRGPLRRERETVNDWGVDLALDGIPLMSMPVKDVGFFDASMDDPELGGVTSVVAVRQRAVNSLMGLLH